MPERRLFVDLGDTVRLTAPLIREFLQAVRRGDDHVRILGYARDPETGEIRLEIGPGAVRPAEQDETAPKRRDDR